MAFWIWILACLLGCWGLGLAGIDQDVTDDLSKDPFTIDVTQHDICPTLWPIDHIMSFMDMDTMDSPLRTNDHKKNLSILFQWTATNFWYNVI